jgi:uncharacterized membrane protein YeaQ/YmgE (transglycosylase-associated protein family)
MFHLIWSVIVGFVAGLIARAVLPGSDQMGYIATTVVGIVGSVIGGFIGTLIQKPSPDSKFHPAGFLMSIVGAIVLLLVIRLLR